MPPKYLNLILLSLVLPCSKGESEIKYIISSNNFTTFINNVNSGTNYNEKTVLLDSDLSLSGEALEPIGNNINKYFSGVFDGQGHVISGLSITTYSQYTGLFGYSSRMAIRNVVLDSSCTITNKYSGSSNAYVGGLIGHCHANDEQCKIENSVNMADVAFSGDITKFHLYIGGIVGYVDSSKYDSYVKNCANYGSVTYSGNSKYSYIGGIVGHLSRSTSNYAYLYNCLNYGTISYDGTSSSGTRTGGIVGLSDYANIENCVSSGKISLQTTGDEDKSAGSIVGFVKSDTYINYCYYTSELSEYKIYGYAQSTPSSSYTLSYDNTRFELSGTVSVGSYAGTSLIDALNAAADYYVLRDYSKWLLNKEKKSVTFTINIKTSPITMNSQVILLPSLASEGNITFSGWYNDTNSNPLESFNITGDKTLYGKFEENANNYTITFDTRREGISVAPITAQFGVVVALPSEPTRNYCDLLWENDYGDIADFSFAMPSRNFTLYAVWKCTHITTLEDFIGFSKVVNSGTDDFSGATVYLDSDLTLPNITYPINYFLGVFDGQGHVISDLSITTYSQYTGLFGYSSRMAIRNVVLGSSCSITSSFNSSNHAYIGGLIGYCNSNDEQCNIENNVNMANVAFSGNTSYSLYLGGIVGYIASSKYGSYVENCANYGSVTHSGTSTYSYIGGIVGYLSRSTSNHSHLYNCLNYGSIAHDGKSSSGIRMGGIVGYSDYAHIENCVSTGKISKQTTPSSSYIGSIVGHVKSDTYINYCYYTSDLGGYDLYGEGTPTTSSYTLSYDNTTFELSGTVSIGSYTGTSLIDALNTAADYYFLRDYSKWLLNKEKESVNFTINSRTSPIAMNSQVILLPSLANGGTLWFYGWHNDTKYSNPLESFNITGDKTLYGKFEENTNSYIISFDTRREGISVAPITAQFGTSVQLPNDVTRDDCSFLWWETGYGDNMGLSLIMPARNFTLYAVWKCTRITSPEDFIGFSKAVNAGIDDFSGATVLLDSDLTLPNITDPINHFLGVFDGQGHVISDLSITTYSQYTGLFGYSSGVTIRNVVLDSSCSITSSHSGSNDVCNGGLIGYCYANSEQCNIENSVNMANVTFFGNVTNNNLLHIGGIVGRLSSSSSISYVKNCANYGSITYLGNSNYSYIGGIVGHFSGSTSNYAYLYNCLNYGSITYNGKSLIGLRTGGIVGLSDYANIENCVSTGKISTQTTNNEDKSVGSIVGYVKSDTYINYCYYTSDVGEYLTNRSGNPIIDSETSRVEVNTTLVDTLNDYTENTENNTWNKWLLNTNNATITFKINNNEGFNVTSQIILLPDLAIEETTNTFIGWYVDAMLTSLFTGDEVKSGTTLYGMLCGLPSYTVMLDVNGDNVSPSFSSGKVAITCNNKYYGLVDLERDGYNFLGWFTESEGGNKIESGDNVTNQNDHTLYAHWGKDSNLILIIAIAAVVIVVIVVVIVLLIILRRKKGNNDKNNDKNNTQDIELDCSQEGEYCRIVATTIEDTEIRIASENNQGILTNLYPQGYERPEMEDALLEAGLTEEQIIYICCGCENVSQRAFDNGMLFEGFTGEDAAAIAMYTYDFGTSNFESNPYRIINKSLVGRNYNNLQKASGLLYLVMTALRKLPKYTGKTLYRGIRGDMNLDKDHYRRGNIITWSALSSTSPDIDATKAFLARGSKSGKAKGTLFIIEGGWGYNIQPYSLFPDEIEILLEPERLFRVTGVVEAEGLAIINLQMLNTPLSIPEVFGGEAY